jgi:hypothetical protein
MKFAMFNATSNFDHRVEDSIQMVLTELQFVQF